MINDDISKINSTPKSPDDVTFNVPYLDMSIPAFYDTSHVLVVLWNKVKELEEKLKRITDSLAI